MSRTKIFADYLDVVGFEEAPFAWHMSGLKVDDHNLIIDALKGAQVESMG